MNAKFTNNSNNAPRPPYRGYANAACFSSYWWPSLADLFWTNQFRKRKQMAWWLRAHKDSLSVIMSIKAREATYACIPGSRENMEAGGWYGRLACYPTARWEMVRVRCSQRPSQGNEQKARTGHLMSSRVYTLTQSFVNTHTHFFFNVGNQQDGSRR